MTSTLVKRAVHYSIDSRLPLVVSAVKKLLLTEIKTVEPGTGPEHARLVSSGDGKGSTGSARKLVLHGGDPT